MPIDSFHIEAENFETAGNANAIRGRDREEISTPVEATNRSPKQHRLRLVSDRDGLEIILFPR